MSETNVCVKIDNTNNILQQHVWSRLCGELSDLAESFGVIGFSGGSPVYSVKQQFAIIVKIPTSDMQFFTEEVTKLRDSYEKNTMMMIIGGH